MKPFHLGLFSRAIARLLALVCLVFGCHADVESEGEPIGEASHPRHATLTAASATPSPATCPQNMVSIPGGLFWMGPPWAVDKGLHQVAVRSFCLDPTEVTSEAYQACVGKGVCAPTHTNEFSCNSEKLDTRAKHPINCVDYKQAESACKSWKKRLPTEQEWEYAARGGSKQRSYSWGEAPPEGRACYNHTETCPVKKYPAGAFGLFDMTGNVWEWTSSVFEKMGDWKLPKEFRVYRGGSYSRRFPKWMRTWMRNRFRPHEWGAHLGFRCAADLPDAPCPVGSHAGKSVTGCVPDKEASPPIVRGGDRQTPSAAKSGTTASGPKPLSVSRQPSVDDDCERYKPGRPVGYLIRGGSYAERESAKRRKSCINRDVGMDFNSICCP